jgi:hypothetical protein
MQRSARFVFAVLLLLGSLAAHAYLGPPRTTPVYQGSGATCAEAESAAEWRAWQDVYLWCYYWNYGLGHCEADFIVTQSCSCQDGVCTVSGYYSYRCVVGEQCGCEPYGSIC